MIDPNAGDYELQVCMSPSMAMLKLRAFVQDLGGKIVDAPVAQPGVTHVRLRSGGKSAPPWTIPGAESWSGTGTAAKAPPSGLDLDMELRVQQPNPSQPNNITIGVTLRAARNAWAVSRREIKEKYEKVVRDLRAYLCAITSSPGDFIPQP